MFKHLISKLTQGKELTDNEISELINAIKHDEISEVQLAGFLVAFLMKGATIQEVVAITKAMRACCTPLKPQIKAELMDTCGTGGGLSTFNISTATAIVAAAAGIPVAKHGSRSISSLSGSADVLEALGVEIKLSPRTIEKMIEEIGIAFIYAPLFHPVMSKVLPIEKMLGIKTIFYTMIGPLINPAFASMHLLGVYKPEMLDIVTQTAKQLSFTNAMFVHGIDGLDEISLLGETRINELKNGEINTYEIAPEDFGLRRCTLEDLKSDEPSINAKIIKGVFEGKISGAKRDAIVFNSAGALKTGEKADNLAQGIKLANELIDSGAVALKLKQLCEMSHSFKQGNYE